MKAVPQNYATSKHYEALVQSLVEQEMSGVSGLELLKIQRNVKMKGLSGYEHQIDVAYRFRIWAIEILVIVECKQYHKHVGIDDLLEFRSRLEDLKAHKGLFVTSSGFQSGAEEFAKANRIALLIARGATHKHVLYSLLHYSLEEECQMQVQQLREAHEVERTLFDSRVSIDQARHRVVVAHRNATLSIEPQELNYSMLHRRACSLDERESENALFFEGRQLGRLRREKLLKSIVLETILAYQGSNGASDDRT